MGLPEDNRFMYGLYVCCGPCVADACDVVHV